MGGLLWIVRSIACRNEHGIWCISLTIELSAQHLNVCSQMWGYEVNFWLYQLNYWIINSKIECISPTFENISSTFKCISSTIELSAQQLNVSAQLLNVWCQCLSVSARNLLEITKHIRQQNTPSDWRSNSNPPEQEAGVPTGTFSKKILAEKKEWPFFPNSTPI